MILNRSAVLQDDEQKCYIGLKPVGSFTLILYHIFISLYFCFLFIFLLVKIQLPSQEGNRDIIKRTLLGTAIAMILSSANIFTLVYFQGYEDSIFCLFSCTLDITLSATIVHWITLKDGSDNNINAGAKSSLINSINTPNSLTSVSHLQQHQYLQYQTNSDGSNINSERQYHQYQINNEGSNVNSERQTHQSGTQLSMPRDSEYNIDMGTY
jgi:hypothetical protein